MGVNTVVVGGNALGHPTPYHPNSLKFHAWFPVIVAIDTQRNTFGVGELIFGVMLVIGALVV